MRGRLVVNSLPLAIDAAARGLGIARLPGALVNEGLAANQLVEVLDAYVPRRSPSMLCMPAAVASHQLRERSSRSPKGN